MFKIIGALLTLTASSALGICFCEDLASRQKILGELLQMMNYISDRITVECDSLADAFLHTAGRLEEPYAGFLRQVSSRMEGDEGIPLDRIWQEEAERLKDVVGRRETEELQTCMGQTGFADKTQQTDYIGQYCQYLEKELAEIEKTKAEKGKVYKTIGIMTGILCVVILW